MGLSLQSVTKGTNVTKAISKLSWAIGPFAFIEQLTEKDRANWGGMPLEDQALEAIAVIAGRVAGIAVPGARNRYPKTFRPWQAVTNKYTGFWIAVEIVGTIIKSVAPFTGKFINPVQKIARIAVVPGAVGAIFDDIVPKKNSNDPQKQAMYYNSSVLTRMR